MEFTISFRQNLEANFPITANDDHDQYEQAAQLARTCSDSRRFRINVEGEICDCMYLGSHQGEIEAMTTHFWAANRLGQIIIFRTNRKGNFIDLRFVSNNNHADLNIGDEFLAARLACNI